MVLGFGVQGLGPTEEILHHPTHAVYPNNLDMWVILRGARFPPSAVAAIRECRSYLYITAVFPYLLVEGGFRWVPLYKAYVGTLELYKGYVRHIWNYPPETVHTPLTLNPKPGVKLPGLNP